MVKKILLMIFAAAFLFSSVPMALSDEEKKENSKPKQEEKDEKSKEYPPIKFPTYVKPNERESRAKEALPQYPKK